MNWYQVTVTHKTWLFSQCEAFLVVFTEKTFSFKNLENAKEKKEWNAFYKGDAADFTFWGILFPLDEREQFMTELFDFRNCSLAIGVVLLAWLVSGDGQAPDDLGVENAPHPPQHAAGHPAGCWVLTE